MKKNAKIYVSGHGGMVGKNMVDLLKRERFHNLILRSSNELDLRNQKEVEAFFENERPEYVFHFAARVGGIMANILHPAEFLYENLMISANVIHAAYKCGVKKMLYLGSSCMYPRECPQPMKEEYLLSGSLEPTNEGYAIAKIAALKLIEAYNKEYKTNFLSLISCNLYGIHERYDEIHSHVAPALIMKIHNAKVNKEPFVELWGTGKARREFIFAADIARAALHFVTHDYPDLAYSYVNIGPGQEPVSIQELAEMICDVVGYNGKIKWDSSKPDGMPHKVLEVSRMKQCGFEPKVSLKDGLNMAYDYYLKAYQAVA